MSKEERIYLSQILFYILVWSIFATILYGFLRYRQGRLFSNEKYENLITSVSSNRLPAIDPCQYFINGDPVTSEGYFAKVIFYCDKDKKAVNSVDLSVLSENNYAALIMETGRINGFEVEEMINPPSSSDFGEAKWKCFDDHERITNFKEKIKVRSRVECFFDYSDEEIKTFYDKS